MVSLQSALLPEASKRPPCLSFADASVVASTATSKKRKRDGEVEEEEEHDGIELNFDAAPLPLEWQRCLDIKVRCVPISTPVMIARSSIRPCMSTRNMFVIVF